MPTLEQLNAYADDFNQSETLKFLSAKVAFPSLDIAEVRIDPVPAAHRGGLGSNAVNGGILSAVFDLAIGITPALVDPRRRSATFELSINFMRPVKGDVVLARSKIERASESIIFSSAQILDEKGQVCSSCSGIIRFSQALWSRGISPRVN